MRPMKTSTTTLAIALCAVMAPAAGHAITNTSTTTTLLNSYDPALRDALSAELSTCSGCALQQLSDGTPDIVYPTDSHPQASTATAPVSSISTPAASVACTASASTVARAADAYRALGNSWFGVYYRAASRSSTTPSATSRAWHADVENAVGGSIFGHSLDAVRTEAAADANNVGYRRLGAKLYARNRYGMMVLVSEKSASGEGMVSTPPITTSTQFWSGDYPFTLGIVPVTVHGELTGSASYLAAGVTRATQAYVTGTPTAGLYARGSISADIVVLAAGVDGQLTVAQGSLPTTAAMQATSTGYAYTYDSGLQMTLLRGSISAWVRLGVWRFSKTWRRTLVSWPGWTYDVSLYHAAATVPSCSQLVFTLN